MSAATLLLSLLLMPAPAQQLPTYDQAVALARSGDHRAALDAFRRIVSEAPGDHDSRVWIGRLLGWLGHP